MAEETRIELEEMANGDCPFCHGTVEVTERTYPPMWPTLVLEQTVVCDNCGRAWKETYQIVKAVEIEPDQA